MSLIHRFLFCLSGVLLFSCANQKEEVLEHWENGQVKKIKIFSNNPDNYVLEHYYENGVLAEITRYESDKRQGLSNEYFENGNKKLAVYYRGGKEDGSWTSFYETGEINIKGISKDGKFKQVKEYYPSGSLAYEMNYDPPGILNGTVKYYHEGGELMTMGSFEDNLKVDNWKSFNVHGDIIGDYFYHNNKMVKKIENFEGEYHTQFERGGKVLIAVYKTVLENVQDTLFNLEFCALDSLGEKISTECSDLKIRMGEGTGGKLKNNDGEKNMRIVDQREYKVGNQDYYVFKILGDQGEGLKVNYFFSPRFGVVAIFESGKNNSITRLMDTNITTETEESFVQFKNELENDSTFFVYSRLRFTKE